MIRAVFFDAGHTLLYAHPSIGAIYVQETAKLGTQVPEERFGEVFKPAFEEFVGERSKVFATDEGDFAMWREITRRMYDLLPELREIDFETWFRMLYDRFGRSDSWRFYPDTEPALAALRKRGLKTGVVSNWDTRLRGIVAGTGLTDLIDVLVISADIGVRKPDPAIFERALELAGVAPEEAMHVGDLFEEDVIGAHRAGLHPVLLDREGHGSPDADFEMTVVRDLSFLQETVLPVE